MRFDEIVNTLLGEYGAPQQEQPQAASDTAMQIANDPISQRKAVNIAKRKQAEAEKLERETLKAAEMEAQQLKKAADDQKKANMQAQM